MNFSSNLSFTLYDIASHIIPGSAALMVISKVVPEKIGNYSFDTISLVVFGFILGHIFHVIGSLLTMAVYSEDYGGVYTRKTIVAIDRLTKMLPPNEKQTSPEIKEELWKGIKRKYGYDPVKKNSLKLFQFADVIASKGGYDERNILLAREGFFRSLIGFTAVITVFFLVTYPVHLVWILIGSVATLKLLFYQHEHVRRIKNNQIYVYALIKLNEHDEKRLDR